MRRPWIAQDPAGRSHEGIPETPPLTDPQNRPCELHAGESGLRWGPGRIVASFNIVPSRNPSDRWEHPTESDRSTWPATRRLRLSRPGNQREGCTSQVPHHAAGSNSSSSGVPVRSSGLRSVRLVWRARTSPEPDAASSRLHVA